MPATADRQLAPVAGEQHGHDAAGGHGAIQRNLTRRRSPRDGPGVVRRPGEQRLRDPVPDVAQRHVAEVLRIRFAGQPVLLRPEHGGCDAARRQGRRYEKQPFIAVELVREAELAQLRAERQHASRQSGESDLQNGRAQVPGLAGRRVDRRRGDAADEQRNPAGEAPQRVAVVLVPEFRGRHHEAGREHVHQVQVVGDQQSRGGRLRPRGSRSGLEERVRRHSPFLAPQRLGIPRQDPRQLEPALRHQSGGSPPSRNAGAAAPSPVRKVRSSSTLP